MGLPRSHSHPTASPKETVAFLNDRLGPATLDTQRIEKLLVDLDSDSFAVREAATHDLTRLRYEVDPLLLRRALENKPSLELRRRLEAILAEPKKPSTEALRTLRAIAVLERIGTPEARLTLKKLAGGADVPQTCAAQAALRRLNHGFTSSNGSVP